MTSKHANVKERPAHRCVHHWIVEPAGGPTSGARCRRCGEERAFYNNPEAVTEEATRMRSGLDSPHRPGQKRDA